MPAAIPPSPPPSPKPAKPKPLAPPFSLAPSKKTWRSRILSATGKSFGVAGLAATFIGTYFQFVPSIDVEPISATFSDDIDELRFQITNNTPTPVFGVAYASGFWDGDWPSTILPMGGTANGQTLRSHVSITIKPDFGYMESTPNDQSPFNIKGMKRPIIYLIVTFVPFGIKCLQTHACRLFYGVKLKSGVYAWFPMGGGADVRGDEPRPTIPADEGPPSTW